MQSIISLFQKTLKGKSILPFLLLGFFINRPLSAEHWSELHKSRIHLQEVDSTQLFAKVHIGELGLDEPGKWIMFTANRQTNAIGPQGKKWESSCDGNLYATFVTLYPKNRLNDISCVLQLSTLSVAQALGEYGIEAKIKLANDIMVRNKKISSCFCELIPSPLEDFCYLLIGVNININMTSDQIFPIPFSTSMLIETGKEFDKEMVLKTVSCCLKNSISYFLKKGTHPEFFNEINQYLAFKGERVEVELGPNSIVEGKLIGIDKDGALLLKVGREDLWKINGGRILRVLANDVSRA